MAKFTFTWSERYNKTIEADSMEEAVEMLNEDETGEFMHSFDYECEVEEDSPTS